MNEPSRAYSALGPPEAAALRSGTAAAVRAALLTTRARTLALADDYAQALGDGLAVPFRRDLNPPLWELGHTAWFQEWWLGRNPQRPRGRRADPACERGGSLLPDADALYDSSRVAHDTRWGLPLPDAAATRQYLAQVLQQSLASLDALGAQPAQEALYFYRLAVLHEQMHAEAAEMMAQTLGIDVRPRAAPVPLQEPRELELRPATVRLGPRGKASFAFDNELASHEVAIEGGWLDMQPVSWRSYLAFIDTGGYDEAQWWDEAGLQWKMSPGTTRQLAVRRQDGQWQRRRGSSWTRINMDEAAMHLTAFEAEAWCRWAGRRLPSEAEWEAAALSLPRFRWGHAWEWTSTTFQPYRGFEPHPYRDYSLPWFGTHRVLRGASPATAPLLAHARYRNFFEPHRNDVFAGFRSIRPRAGATGPAL